MEEQRGRALIFKLPIVATNSKEYKSLRPNESITIEEDINPYDPPPPSAFPYSSRPEPEQTRQKQVCIQLSMLSFVCGLWLIVYAVAIYDIPSTYDKYPGMKTGLLLPYITLDAVCIGAINARLWLQLASLYFTVKYWKSISRISNIVCLTLWTVSAILCFALFYPAYRKEKNNIPGHYVDMAETTFAIYLMYMIGLTLYFMIVLSTRFCLRPQ
jgi:hypothetical protein